MFILEKLTMRDLCEKSFEARFISTLSPPNLSFSLVTPTPVAAPSLLAWSSGVAADLGLTSPQYDSDGVSSTVHILAGNALTPTMRPYSARYGGHQFGQWAGQLGDGRAITLGELRNVQGELRELQLKGAGPTPYSRRADGRAVLRSSLREYLCSEAMHALGIPTTRALSLVATGDVVQRDMFYDGHIQGEPGAIVCRISPSFTRFGNFELHAAHAETNELKRLADWVITEHYLEFDLSDPNIYASWFKEICERTAVMIVHWMRVGFVHGVMNTDNMSILGLTLDYGPYGWLEGYDSTWTPNTTDSEGRRYAYGNQPAIALWNLECLGGALLSLVGSKESILEGLEHYKSVYHFRYNEMVAKKLGLEDFQGHSDIALLDDLFSNLTSSETDMTIFFRELGEASVHPVRAALYDQNAWQGNLVVRWEKWLSRYAKRVELQSSSEQVRRELMRSVNPCYVPRNYLAQQAIDAATQGDLHPLHELLAVLSTPYQEQAGRESYAARRPEWARNKAGCSALSCSS